MTAARFLVVAEKAAPPTGGSTRPFGTKPQGGADAMPAIPEQEDLLEQEEQVDEEEASRSWAGDLIDESVTTPTDPAGAYTQFTGEQGEVAWLDRREDDLTLTGWVRDVDGSVYQYTDADAWAVDVDDAGMVRTDGADAEDEEVLDEEAMAQEDGSAVEGQEDFLEGKHLVLRVVHPKA